MKSDAEANYAYYALHKLKIRVKDFYDMSEEERLVTIAFIDIRIEEEAREYRKVKGG